MLVGGGDLTGALHEFRLTPRHCHHLQHILLQKNSGWFDIRVPSYPHWLGNWPLKRAVWSCGSLVPSFNGRVQNQELLSDLTKNTFQLQRPTEIWSQNTNKCLAKKVKVWHHSGDNNFPGWGFLLSAKNGAFGCIFNQGCGNLKIIMPVWARTYRNNTVTITKEAFCSER